MLCLHCTLSAAFPQRMPHMGCLMRAQGHDTGTVYCRRTSEWVDLEHIRRAHKYVSCDNVLLQHFLTNVSLKVLTLPGGIGIGIMARASLMCCLLHDAEVSRPKILRRER